MSEDMEMVTAIKHALEVLIRGLDQYKPTYEPLQEVIVNLLFGQIPRIIVACDDGEDGACSVEGCEPFGGFWQMHESLMQLIETMELEEVYAEPCKDFGDYTI
jgi:hypothetical protein